MLQVHDDVILDALLVCVLAFATKQCSFFVEHLAASTIKEVCPQRNVHFVIGKHVVVVAHKFSVRVPDVFALCSVYGSLVRVPVQVHALLAVEDLVRYIAAPACALVYPLWYVEAVHAEPVHVHPPGILLRSSNNGHLPLLCVSPASSRHCHGKDSNEEDGDVDKGAFHC